MLPLILGAVGAGLKLYGEHKKNKEMKKIKGPNIDAIKAEMNPWKQSIDKAFTQAANYTTQGQGIVNQGQGLMAQATDMADPRGSYQRQQSQFLRENLMDTGVSQQMSQSFAQRGMGGGGISSLMAGLDQSRAGESLRRGMGDIQNQGFQRSMALRGQGMGLMGQGYDVMGTGTSQFNLAMGQQKEFGESTINLLEHARGAKNKKLAAEAQHKANMFGGLGSMVSGFGSGLG